jgi:Tfp pilus assembly protein PilN
MADINLLQSQIKDTTFLSDRRVNIFTVLICIVLVVLLGVGIVLYVLTLGVRSKTANLVSENTTIQDQISNQQTGLSDAKSYQAKLTNIATLLNSHSYLSPLLDELDNKTFQKAKYLTFDVGSDTDKVHLEGQVNSYNDLGKLILGLGTSKYFNNVKLLTVLPSRGATDTYIFSVDMNVDPTIFFNKNKQ